jgi:hypothetical protein
MHGQQPEQDMLLKPLHNALQQPDAYLLSPEPAGTPQSMDLTNDTMQTAGGPGGFPGFNLRDENDSLELGAYAAAGGGLFAGRDGTYNITGDVPSECWGQGGVHTSVLRARAWACVGYTKLSMSQQTLVHHGRILCRVCRQVGWSDVYVLMQAPVLLACSIQSHTHTHTDTHTP